MRGHTKSKSPRIGITFVAPQERRYHRDRYRPPRWAREGKIKGAPRPPLLAHPDAREHPVRARQSPCALRGVWATWGHGAGAEHTPHTAHARRVIA